MKFLVGLIAACQLFGSLSAESLAKSKEALLKCQVYRYPYSDLPLQLKKQGQESILIFTFGSLLDNNSAAKTFSKEAIDTRYLAVAVGTRRSFNRDIPLLPHYKWGMPRCPEARGMLNLITTGSDHDVTNGILMEVPIKDIPAMRKRECGYDLVPIIVAQWHDYLVSESPDFTIAYTFHAPDNTSYTSDDIYPRPGYYEFARDAAKRQGPLFYEMWITSTFLSDKKTPITVWEEAVKNGHEYSLIRSKEPACP